jgi:hypothetical protein
MMNAEETVLLLTWVNQHDPRVQLNAASRDIWAYSLSPFTAAEAKQAILDHYRLNDSIPVTPGAIRKRADDHRAVTEGRESAMKKLPASSWPNPNSWRKRNPEEWDRLVEQGRQAREDDLRARGLWK